MLSFTSLLSFINPNIIQNYANYKGEDTLIINWAIYAITLNFIILFKNYYYPTLFCYIISILWNIYMFQNNLINNENNFIYVALIGNLLGILELLIK